MDEFREAGPEKGRSATIRDLERRKTVSKAAARERDSGVDRMGGTATFHVRGAEMPVGDHSAPGSGSAEFFAIG